MRLSAKRRNSWMMIASEPAFAQRSVVHFDGEDFEVVSMGSGDPLVVVPGMAGGWRLTTPLLRRLARDRRVITYGLRGDRTHGEGPLGQTRTPYVEISRHADEGSPRPDGRSDPPTTWRG